MKAYLIPDDEIIFKEEIKKSRFITYLAHTEGKDDAKQYIDSLKKRYSGARHHCWAFVAGRPDDPQQLGFSDDGEPAGTAGKPILAQLLGSHIGEITCVIVRYFGGVKLGTGGLVKAYGNGVQQALKRLQTKTKVPQTFFWLTCDYPQISLVEQLVTQYEGSIITSAYDEKVILHLSLPSLQAEVFNERLRSLSHGTLKLPLKS